ncbi:MAG: hypothetical protein GC181_10705 [Bacteroidetes bacterium]|nr:hypothetical protein [Bacteroidota bacterium]
MKRLLFVICFGALFSCQNNDVDSIQPNQPNQPIKSESTDPPHGEDENEYTWQTTCIRQDSIPVVDAVVTLSFSDTTFVDTTDGMGKATTILPWPGQFLLTVRKEGYLPFDSLVYVLDSFQTLKLVLTPE